VGRLGADYSAQTRPDDLRRFLVNVTDQSHAGPDLMRALRSSVPSVTRYLTNVQVSEHRWDADKQTMVYRVAFDADVTDLEADRARELAAVQAHKGTGS
jgi:hypothetical protein